MPINHTTNAGGLVPPNVIGATDWDDAHAVTGTVEFPAVTTPTAPAADKVGIFARKIAGRMMPAYIGPSGLDSAMQPLIARNKIALANPRGNATQVDVLGMAVAATGAATSANVGTATIQQAMRRLEYAVTTASTTAVAGWRSSVLQYHIGSPSTPYGGFFLVCRFGRSRGSAANSTLRGFTGFGSITAAPTDASDPSSQVTNAIGVGCDAGDTNYHVIHRSGTAAATKVDTGIEKAVADTTEMYEVAIFTSPSDSNIYVQFTRLSDNTVFNHTISTNKPADTTLIAPRGYYSVGGTSSVIGYALSSLYIETDY